MKPIVIISIAVVCSIAGTLGVLIAWQGMATMQAQEIYDEYQTNIENQQQLEDELYELAFDFNREVCVELYANTMSAFGEANPYQNCLDYGFVYQTKQKESECSYLNSEIVSSNCRLKTWVDFYDTFMPKAQKLSEEDRESMGLDKLTMEEFSKDWQLKSLQLRESHETIQGVIDGNIDLDSVDDKFAEPVNNVPEEYDNLKPTQFAFYYDGCMLDNSEAYCQKQFNIVVNDYCYDKITYYFGDVPPLNYQIQCVSKTLSEVIDNQPITLENESFIKECLFNYSGRDDVNLMSICLLH